MAFAIAAAALLAVSNTALAAPAAADSCATIAGKTWAVPADVRECYNSFAFNSTIRDNLVDTVSKTLSQFHTSVTYTLHQPYPYNEISVDILAELARVRKTTYKNDFALHYDLQQTVRKLKDGHAGYINYCYDSAFTTYLPFPLAVFDGSIHIAPESYDVIVGEFGQAVVDEWQKDAKVQFQKYAGAKVLAIDFKDPWKVVDENAAVVGGYQTHTTRQNSFFSSYQSIAPAPGWAYRLGDFAYATLPLRDKVTLSVVRSGKLLPEIITIPTRSRISPDTLEFTDKASYWTNNCLAKSDTNGEPFLEASAKKTVASRNRPASEIRAGNEGSPAHNPAISAALEDAVPPVRLPVNLVPSLTPLDGSIGDLKFYLLPDKKTGVLALGSFSYDYAGYYDNMPIGLQTLKDAGATRLIIDVTNNGGGYVCIAAWLNRLLAGAIIEPNTGLDTQMRAQSLAQQIVKKITSNPAIDPNVQSLYNPRNWGPAEELRLFNATEDYLTPGVTRVINGVKDHFSVRLGHECYPFDAEPPSTEKAFSFDNVVIVNNGRCASSCTLLSIPLAKKFGIRTVVVGGKPGTTQQYAGVVGGQSYSYAGIDSEIKSFGLKSSPLAPPDFILDAYQGFTFRLGFALKGNTDSPEEFAPHDATYNWQLTKTTVNNPVELWKSIASSVFRR